MSRQHRARGFKDQMRQSMADLEWMMSEGKSPTGDGRFTTRTMEVVDPGRHDAKSIRRIRRSLNLSQVLFARLIGVSPALIRAWELGTRSPAPIARRLLDQVRNDPKRFEQLIRVPSGSVKPRVRRVA
jgi:DNA-binding transcriptional regulator YiaG